MKKINFKIKNVRLAFTLLIILAFIVLLLYYHFVLSPSFAKSNFTNQMIEIADENENSIYPSTEALDTSAYTVATLTEKEPQGLAYRLISTINKSFNAPTILSLFIM